MSATKFLNLRNYRMPLNVYSIYRCVTRPWGCKPGFPLFVFVTISVWVRYEPPEEKSLGNVTCTSIIVASVQMIPAATHLILDPGADRGYTRLWRASRVMVFRLCPRSVLVVWLPHVMRHHENNTGRYPTASNLARRKNVICTAEVAWGGGMSR